MRIWDRRQAHGCCACHWLGVPALSLAWEPSAQVLMAVGECFWSNEFIFKTRACCSQAETYHTFDSIQDWLFLIDLVLVRHCESRA